MRWFFFILGLVYAVAWGVLMLVPHRFFWTPSSLALVSVGLGVLVCSTSGAAWHRPMRRVFLLLAIPVTMLGVMGELALWRTPAAYSLEATCDEVDLRPTENP